MEKCAAVLEESRLASLKKADYPLHDGRFGDVYEEMTRSPFILRADFPLNRVADFVRALDGGPALSRLLLDFGCGRVLASLDVISKDDWQHLCELVDQRDGHGLLVKAPDDFRKQNDVFGSPRSGWKVMHRIKAAMDPDHLFGPGSLPGKV